MKTNAKKILGAVIPFLITEAIMVISLLAIIYLKIFEVEELPLLMFIFLVIYLLIPIICLIVSLSLRLKEIKSGEEEEASKY